MDLISRIAALRTPAALRTFFTAIALWTILGAATTPQAQPTWNATGALRSEALSSRVTGPAKTDTLQSTESSQSSALDLALRYHPSDRISVRTDFRFHQDWRALPSGEGGVAALRSLAAEGTFGPGFSFHAGDFRRRLTPLTLWTPAPELLEEPDLLSRRRETVMSERLATTPDRNLEGADLAYDRTSSSALTSLHADVLGSRLRRAEYLDNDGAQGLGLDRADMDRILLGGGLEARLWDRLWIGGGLLRLADDASTYETFPLSPETRKAAFGNAPDPGTSLNGRDSVPARALSLTHLRAGLDLGRHLPKAGWTLETNIEAAFSDASSRLAWGFRPDTVNGAPRNVPVTRITGREKDRALAFAATVGWRDTSAGNAFSADLRRLDNGANFLNPLAQTPAFAPARILNTGNDPDGSLYTAFDALYNGVYRSVPSRRSPGHHPAPYQKNAYTRGVWSPEDLQAFRPDPLVQLGLPFGDATPNRIGWSTHLTTSWRDALLLSGSGAWLSEKEAAKATPGEDSAQGPSKFALVAAGIRFNAHGLFPSLPPMTFNAGLSRRESNPFLADSADKIRADLNMAGFRLQATRRWALLGAWQGARIERPASPDTETQLETLQHWRAAVEFAVTRSAYLQVGAGRLSLEADSTRSFAQTQAHATLHAGF